MHMILIAGQAGVGKTTLAKLIAKEIFEAGQQPMLLSFAGPLKDEASRKGYSKEINPEKYREFCQNIGATRRAEDPDFWIKKFDKKIQQVKTDEEEDIKNNEKYWERVVIIDDCRYINELAYGKLYNAVSIFISAGDRELEDKEWRQHHSEAMARSIETNDDPLIDAFYDLIYNSGTIEDLEKIVKRNGCLWSGLKVGCDTNTVCGCQDCVTKRNETLPLLKDVIENLVDLLFLSELDPEDEKDEDEEEDEDDLSDDSDSGW